MLENKVGIWSNIENLLQNVLRELEQKKPQLDDLVRTADSLRDSPIKQKIPAKGKSRLNNLVRTAEKQFKLCLMSRPIQQQFLFKCTMPSTGLFENNGKNDLQFWAWQILHEFCNVLHYAKLYISKKFRNIYKLLKM